MQIAAKKCPDPGHSQKPITVLCIEDGCQGKRLLCAICAIEDHKGHLHATLNNDPTSVLSVLSMNESAPNRQEQADQILSLVQMLKDQRSLLEKEIQKCLKWFDVLGEELQLVAGTFQPDSVIKVIAEIQSEEIDENRIEGITKSIQKLRDSSLDFPQKDAYAFRASECKKQLIQMVHEMYMFTKQAYGNFDRRKNQASMIRKKKTFGGGFTSSKASEFAIFGNNDSSSKYEGIFGPLNNSSMGASPAKPQPQPQQFLFPMPAGNSVKSSMFYHGTQSGLGQPNANQEKQSCNVEGIDSESASDFDDDKKSERLTFSAKQTLGLFKKKEIKGSITKTGVIFLTAVLQYMSAEVLQLSGNSSKDRNRNLITSFDIMKCFQNDEELFKLVENTPFMLTLKDKYGTLDQAVKSIEKDYHGKLDLIDLEEEQWEDCSDNDEEYEDCSQKVQGAHVQEGQESCSNQSEGGKVETGENQSAPSPE